MAVNEGIVVPEQIVLFPPLVGGEGAVQLILTIPVAVDPNQVAFLFAAKESVEPHDPIA